MDMKWLLWAILVAGALILIFLTVGRRFIWANIGKISFSLNETWYYVHLYVSDEIEIEYTLRAETLRTALQILFESGIKLAQCPTAVVVLRRSRISIGGYTQIRGKTVGQVPNEEFVAIARELGILTE